ncbi:GntR family transcriptional regulator [Albidovulum sediminis]|uniref:GntR family transcriptional regulator n=1 Tax=Albidovulum sediminis TaxID=3066345 RepID=A0ABT2NK06_9RHOB|nr:GntR family transcriptional regulator [Defluviimonas sediminis]MCT8328259.1 GntR family transcriptional regulator [Defluviimonas sediminis]
MARSASPNRQARPRSSPRASHLDLAQRILDLARARGMGAGAHLPEQVLATACNVSRTPVRAALDLLVDQGLAEHESSSGYRLAAGFSPASTISGPLPDAAEADLARRILRDRAARRLDETVTVGELIRRYGAARSAVGKALARLAEDGLVTRAPGQSWVFAALPDAPESQADSYEFRLMLEPAALTAPGFRLDPDRAAALRRAMVAFLAEPDDRLDPRAFQTLDAAFHGLIARGAANRFVADALGQHLRLRELPGAVVRANVVRLRQAMQEHLGILDQMEAGRFDVAADLLCVHLRLSRSQRPQAANRGAPPLFGLTYRVGGDG